MSESVSWQGWEVVKLIGRGSFGAVYEIQRKVFDDVESAALKVISIPQNSSDIDEMYSDGYDDETITKTIQSHLQSIVAEYSLMKKMNGCANIVNCDDFKYHAKADGVGYDVYIKMELLTPLTKALPEKITEDTVIKIAKDMCKALKICKKYGVIHRDIKPQNIFVSEHEDYKLGDFGIAKTVEKTMGGTKIGTYKYMAPEVYNNQPYGTSADIYSLGLVLYWLLNERRLPFMPLPPEKPNVGDEEQCRQRRLSGERLPEPFNGSKELKQIVLKACAYNSADRYQDAAEMLNDLIKLGGSDEDVPVIIPASPAPNTFAKDEEKAVTVDDIKTVEEKHETTGDGETENVVVAPVVVSSVIEETKENIEEAKPEKKKSDKNKIIKVAAVIVVVLAGVLSVSTALMDKNDSAVKETELVQNVLQTDNEQQISGDEETNTIDKAVDEIVTEGTVSELQLEWSVWSDKLPDFVNEEGYEIEEKTQYSTRTKRTTSSTKSNTMDGWIYDKTVESGGLGVWSAWSVTAVKEASGREIQTQQLYRYRNLEKTTSSNKTMSGWTLKDTTKSWSNYSAWSDWSTNSVTASDSVKVENKTQYRKRDIIYYGEWSEWSEWSEPTSSSLLLGISTTGGDGKTKERQTKAVSYYYYFLCPGCGKHLHKSGTGACDTSLGGCGGDIPSSAGKEMYHEIVTSQAWYDTGKNYVNIDGGIWFVGRLSGGIGLGDSDLVQVRTRTRERLSTPQYGSWTPWGDAAYEMKYQTVGPAGPQNMKPSLEIETRTVYRYCTRSQITTYHFERWSGWSNWSTESITATNTREVDKTTQYRYRDEVKETTHYFYRWSDWGTYLDGEVSNSDTVEVRTKTQYRYKSK